MADRCFIAMSADPDFQVFPDPAGLAEAGAALVAERLAAALAASGQARLVLANGSTPRELYRRLAAPPWQKRMK